MGCAVLFYVVLCCSMLFYAVLCCSVLFCATLCFSVLHVLVCVVLCCSVLFCAVLCFSVLHVLVCVVLCWTVLCCSVLCAMLLQCLFDCAEFVQVVARLVVGGVIRVTALFLLIKNARANRAIRVATVRSHVMSHCNSRE